MQNYTEILPDLWIGNKHSVEDILFLHKNKIKCIINCTKDLEFNVNYTKAENIRLMIDDHPNTTLYQDNMDLYEKLDDIVNYIHYYLCRGEGVLVFCNACKQRSPSLVAGYIMKYGEVSAKQAIEYIQTKRTDCFSPKVNFYIALQKYDK